MKQQPKYKDFPLKDVLEKANQAIAQGITVHQKFSCAQCGQRLTMPDANTFFATGTCDKCGHVTDIEKQGCNYTLIGSAEVLAPLMGKRRR